MLMFYSKHRYYQNIYRYNIHIPTKKHTLITLAAPTRYSNANPLGSVPISQER